MKDVLACITIGAYVLYGVAAVFLFREQSKLIKELDKMKDERK